jgi:ATP-dependent Clp protease ATP-binding subunit ClpB
LALNPNKWTLKTQEAFNGAVERAKQLSNPEVTPDHLLAALLGQADGLVLPLLNSVGINPTTVKNKVEDAISRLPKAYGGDAGVSRALRDTLERADGERTALGDEYLSTEHLVLALTELLGTTRDALLGALQTVRGNQRVMSQSPEETYRTLEKYGRDLTEAARNGKLDPVVGRDEEIRRTIQVLARRTKNNPVLIGEPGVGKTAIVVGSSRSTSRPWWRERSTAASLKSA